jgi:hypothetical protein
LAKFTGERQLIKRAGKPAIDYSDCDFVENHGAGADTMSRCDCPVKETKKTNEQLIAIEVMGKSIDGLGRPSSSGSESLGAGNGVAGIVA